MNNMINIEQDFRNKRIAVVGFGVEGESSAKFLVGKGARVTILDKKKKEQFNNRAIEQLSNLGIRFVFGEKYLRNLDQFGVIVRSPGVKRNVAEIVEAEKTGVVVTSQTKLFFDHCPGKIIGVTGTKGKGTTASLIYEMLKKQGLSAYLGGNIGQPPFEFLDKLNTHSWVVLELSSFQLLDLTKSPADAKAMVGKPHIAVMLMITSEHLDYHQDTNEYVEAKRNILRFQTASDAAIINRDYPASNESDIHTDVKVFQVSRERDVYEQGCFVRDGKIIVRFDRSHLKGAVVGTQNGFGSQLKSIAKNSGANANTKHFGASPRKNFSSQSSFVSGQASRITREEIVKTSEVLLPGKHNLENVCAAVMAAKLAGVSNKNIAFVLKTFKGLEHRLELVRTVNGVRYYDDSFSTTPETAIAAIEAFEQPEILILGGSSKGSDFTELGRVISQAESIKAIIGIGEEWERIKAQFKVQSSKFKVIEGCKNMHEIVFRASELADRGDVVLLSPACASFDMFKNYKDRGDQFKIEVKNLLTN